MMFSNLFILDSLFHKFERITVENKLENWGQNYQIKSDKEVIFGGVKKNRFTDHICYLSTHMRP